MRNGTWGDSQALRLCAQSDRWAIGCPGKNYEPVSWMRSSLKCPCQLSHFFVRKAPSDHSAVHLCARGVQVTSARLPCPMFDIGATGQHFKSIVVPIHSVFHSRLWNKWSDNRVTNCHRCSYSELVLWPLCTLSCSIPTKELGTAMEASIFFSDLAHCFSSLG
jgi:hypothetical protein